MTQFPPDDLEAVSARLELQNNLLERLQQKCERYEKALIAIEAGFNHTHLSPAEMASLARAALDGD